MEFKKSKKAGDIIEKEILNKYFIEEYPKAYIDDIGMANSKWDIWIPELKYGVEVKGDYKSAETGNIVLEVEMNDKLSALSKTKAKYWVFVEGYRYIWITPLDIYRFIEQNAYNRFPITGDGDTSEKLVYLVSHERFVTYVRKVGKVEMINKESPLYFDNYSKRDDLKKKNKIKP